MKPLTAVVLLILLAVLLLDNADARGGRGGGRSSGSRRGSRGGSRRGSRRGSSSSSRVTKTTKIKPIYFRSPVIKSQAIRGSRTKLFTGVIAGYLVTKYLLRVAPVYRGGFPVYGNYISIPEKRAVRLSSERVSLLDSNGDFCIGRSSQRQTVKDGIVNNLIELNTTVSYNESPGNLTTLFGVNNTVSLDDIKEKNFTVTTRARYNVSVVDNTRCTQVEKQVNGTMIQLYEFNPNTANIANISFNLIVTSFTLFGIFNVYNFA